MVDIRELARQGGVSVATVSRALNGHPEVNARTRQRIIELAARLGYQPSQAARALVRGRSDMIGLIWDTSYEAEGRRQPFLQDLLTGVKRALSNSGYHLLLLSTVPVLPGGVTASPDSPSRGSGAPAAVPAARGRRRTSETAEADPETGSEAASESKDPASDAPRTGGSATNPPRPEVDVDAYVRVARQHRLAAVLLMGVDEHHPAVTALVEAEIPCVGLDLPVRGPRATYVTSDNRVGATRAVRHLHRLGHTRIATITGPMDLMPAVERLAGYRLELARLGLPERPEYIRHGDFFLASGYRCARELLALDEPPTALFAAGDEMAIGAMRAAYDAGLSVPEDLAIVGFDDVEAATLVRPALTTVVQDREGLSVAAVDALRELIDSPVAVATEDGTPAVRPAHRIVATRLEVRESCGARVSRSS